MNKPPKGFSKDAPVIPLHDVGRLSDLLAPAMARARARANGEERPVPTPWQHLNETLGGGFWPGAHFLVAGTGVGKSQLTFQLAMHAAKQTVPVGLIALELDEMSLAIRLASEEAGVVWSKVYNGKASAIELDKVQAVLPMLALLPIRTDFGQAMGWSSERLELMAKALRAEHPQGPICIVLDFIQLVSNPADEKSVDLRERISRAGYTARNIARRYGATVIIISSTARANYGALTSKLSKAGLGIEQGRNGPRRVVRYPDTLIGLGKESGELEFAADSLNVLLRPAITQGQHDSAVGELIARGGKVVVCATVKMRAGVPSWFAMSFERGRFDPLPEESINSLAQGDAEEDEDDEDPTDRVLQAITDAYTANPMAPVKNKAELAKLLKVRRQSVTLAIKQLETEGRIVFRPDKAWVPAKPL